MDNNQIVVGSVDCPLKTVFSILRQSTLIRNDWSTFARLLDVPNAQVKKFRQDLLLGTITHEDLLDEVLEIWMGRNASRATLANLLHVVEGHCGANDVGELLRLEYKLPCKEADDNPSIEWKDLSPAFQKRVIERFQNFTPNLKDAEVLPKWSGAELVSLMRGKRPHVLSLPESKDEDAGAQNNSFASTSQHIETANPELMEDVEMTPITNNINISSELHVAKIPIAHAPTYTNISQDLSKLLASSGDKHNAMFFHRLDSPETLNIKGAGISTKFHSQSWKQIVPHLIQFLESCHAYQFKKNSCAIGERVATMVRLYCSDALNSDFGILSGKSIAPHVVATLPRIVKQVLLLPTLLSSYPLPVLKSGQNGTLFVTKRLCSSLLANAFFSMFSHQRGSLPDINFHRLFHTSSSPERSKVKMEKVMCLLNYFHQMSSSSNQKLGDLIISYERRYMKEWEFPIWERSNKPMINVVVELSKKIEEADGMLQVDFADKVIGDGVTEEILFVICPELILARLFTEPLDNNEVLVIRGAHQFSRYGGNSLTFRFAGNNSITDMDQDNLGRLNTHVVAMDAFNFQGSPTMQFQKRQIDRELRKSYLGFLQKDPIPVATGNWGCGEFHGNVELKFLIQWIAASISGCPSLHYHTVGDGHQAKLINKTVALIRITNVHAGKLYELIIRFCDVMNDYSSIFEFIKSRLLERLNAG